MASAPEFPLDLREMMHDCILEIFWPKKKISEFLIGVGCPESVIPNLQENSRHEIIVETFSQLGSRSDRGYRIFQTMLDRLQNWTYFDPYWFEKVEKLNERSARAKLETLRQSVLNRNLQVSRQQKQASTTKTQAAKSNDLSQLKNVFAKIYGTEMSAQARGRLFEDFLKLTFDKQGVQMGEPFRIIGEQIDGSFKFEGENYIVEAKWQDPSTATNQLYGFAFKVDGKMHGRGVFISVNGYSNESIKAVVHGKHIKTILIDGQDISFVLEGQISLAEMLDFKIRAAQTRGEVYVCALRRKSKV
ncbi:MAG: restriction endonuclease [Alteripontixanthobacter sp.]